MMFVMSMIVSHITSFGLVEEVSSNFQVINLHARIIKYPAYRKETEGMNSIDEIIEKDLSTGSERIQ